MKDMLIALTIVVFILLASTVLSYVRIKLEQEPENISQLKTRISQLESENSVLKLQNKTLKIRHSK